MWYYRDIEHVGLAKFKRIRGNDEYVVQRRAAEQLREWDKQWERQQEIERAQEERLSRAYDRNQKKLLAVHQTEEAQGKLNELRKILANTTSLEHASWTSLYDRSEFNEPSPQTPAYESYPTEPKITDEQF